MQLSEINSGALQEVFDYEFDKVLRNIRDVNTDPKANRTFTEIDQPVSPFVLRINEDMRVALFTADGGAWKQEAMKNIQAYLIEALSDEDGNCPYTIIA